MDKNTTPKLTLRALANALSLSETQVTTLKAKGMDCSSLETAMGWHTANVLARPGSAPKPSQAYPTAEVEGDDGDARFNRLVASETYISEQIAGIQTITIPGLISQVASGKSVERALFQANTSLTTLRREHRATVKQISEIEIRRHSLRGGMVSKEVMLDAAVWFDYVAAEVIRHFSDAIVDFTSKLSSSSGGYRRGWRRPRNERSLL